MRNDLRDPISFERQYKSVVFLNSKMDQQAQVLNRYCGIFQDRKMKVRGIDLRRHGIIRKCQKKMLSTLEKADDTAEFKALLPHALNRVRKYLLKLQSKRVPIEDLIE